MSLAHTKMSHSLVEVLSEYYMWPWIQQFAVSLASLSQRAHEIFQDNMHAEARVVQEDRETEYLVHLWSEDEGYRCGGCGESDCEWCSSWGRGIVPAESTPEWSDGFSDNS